MTLDPYIERVFEGLPDSRCREPKAVIRVVRPDGSVWQAVPAFCASCGKQEGYAVGNVQAILSICDECTKKHGVLPLPQLSQEELKELAMKGDQG